MIRLAFEHPREARAADTLLAGSRDADAALGQYVDDALGHRHGKSAATSGQGHFEGLALAGQGQRIGGEVLDVHGPGRPGRCRHFLDQVHEPARSAQIQVSIGGAARQQGMQCLAQPAALDRAVETHVGHELGCGERGMECGLLDRPGEVMQLEGCSDGQQVARHAQQGRDADAAGDQHVVPGCRMQREVVARCADGQQVTLFDEFVHGARPTVRVGDPLDGDQVAVPLVRIVAQRVLALQAIFDADIDVRARCERGQQGSGRADQLEGLDVGCFEGDPLDAHGHEGHRGRCGRRRLATAQIAANSRIGEHGHHERAEQQDQLHRPSADRAGVERDHPEVQLEAGARLFVWRVAQDLAVVGVEEQQRAGVLVRRAARDHVGFERCVGTFPGVFQQRMRGVRLQRLHLLPERFHRHPRRIAVGRGRLRRLLRQGRAGQGVEAVAVPLKHQRQPAQDQRNQDQAAVDAGDPVAIHAARAALQPCIELERATVAPRRGHHM